jgi:hypothetical protein
VVIYLSIKLKESDILHCKSINFNEMIVMPVKDLSTVHELAGNIFKWPSEKEEWEQYKLSRDQIDFFNENGYLSGVKMLESGQIEQLRTELSELADVNLPGHNLFYEFHSNESERSNYNTFSCSGCMANNSRIS